MSTTALILVILMAPSTRSSAVLDANDAQFEARHRQAKRCARLLTQRDEERTVLRALEAGMRSARHRAAAARLELRRADQLARRRLDATSAGARRSAALHRLEQLGRVFPPMFRQAEALAAQLPETERAYARCIRALGR